MLSAEGRADNDLGATFAARYWMATIDWSYATTSSALAREMSMPNCSGCETFLGKTIDRVRAEGHHYKGGRITSITATVKAADHRNGSDHTVDVSVIQMPIQIADSAGNPVKSVVGGRGVFRVWLKWVSGGWRVAEWKQAV